MILGCIVVSYTKVIASKMLQYLIHCDNQNFSPKYWTTQSSPSRVRRPFKPTLLRITALNIAEGAINQQLVSVRVCPP